MHASTKANRKRHKLLRCNAASAASRLHLCAKNTQSAEPSRHQSGLSVKSRRHRLLQRLLQSTGLQEVSIPHHRTRQASILQDELSKLMQIACNCQELCRAHSDEMTTQGTAQSAKQEVNLPTI